MTSNKKTHRLVIEGVQAHIEFGNEKWPATHCELIHEINRLRAGIANLQKKCCGNDPDKCNGCRALLALSGDSPAASKPAASNEQSCKPLSSDELADLQAAFWPGADPNELRRKLIVAIMQADAKYDMAKVGGTKRWIEGFFLPELRVQGLAICLADETPQPRLNGQALEHRCPLCKEKLLTIIPPEMLRPSAPETTARVAIAGDIMPSWWKPPRGCHANMYSDPPQDCDAPYCGCNPAWTQAIEMLQEIGWKSPDEARKAETALRGLYWDNVDYLTLNKLGGMQNHWMRAAREALGMDIDDVRPSQEETSAADQVDVASEANLRAAAIYGPGQPSRKSSGRWQGGNGFCAVNFQGRHNLPAGDRHCNMCGAEWIPENGKAKP